MPSSFTSQWFLAMDKPVGQERPGKDYGRSQDSGHNDREGEVDNAQSNERQQEKYESHSLSLVPALGGNGGPEAHGTCEHMEHVSTWNMHVQSGHVLLTCSTEVPGHTQQEVPEGT